MDLRTAVLPPVEPMLAQLVSEVPRGEGWQYEPKWDGFRALVFHDGTTTYLQSRDLKPLNRYFPELEAGLGRVLRSANVVLDGEVVIMGERGLDFDALLMRIHPAESRVRMLAEATPASFVAFDLLADGDRDLRQAAFSERTRLLRERLAAIPAPMLLTPSTADIEQAEDWFDRFEGAGLDGVVAKRLDEPYKPGVRAMRKIKHLRTVDCVVGGLRWNKNQAGEAIGSLLLGVYDRAGVLQYVGHTSSFSAPERRALAAELKPLITDDPNVGFGRGRTPGGPSRWSQGKDVSWVRLRPERVCEVAFDHLQGDRFRHASTFKRWRPDKPPEACTYDQLETAVPFELKNIFANR